MKTSISLTKTTKGFPCLHCGEFSSNLRFIEHDVTPEIEPSVTFVFVCERCYQKTFIDLDDIDGGILTIVAVQKKGYR